jgi:MFS family permease
VLIHASSSNISWVGAIQSYCVLLMGFLSGPIFDRGYLRPLLCVGSVLVVVGFMTLSVCHTFWQVLLAQGFCIGIGSGLLFVPAVAILPTYFNTKLGLAIGLAASGSSMGGIIYPIVFYRLLDQIGFGWSVRVLGFLALATLIIPIFVMKQRVKPPRARALFDTTVFRDIPFMLFTLGTMIGFIGLYCVLFYLSFFGEAQGYTDASMSFYIVPILNAASVFGRTLPNALSDKTGCFNIILPGAVVCSILIFCLIAVNGLGSIVVLAILFGFFSGVFIALPPVCFVALTADKSKIGSRIGMAFAFMGFGCLAGVSRDDTLSIPCRDYADADFVLGTRRRRCSAELWLWQQLDRLVDLRWCFLCCCGSHIRRSQIHEGGRQADGEGVDGNQLPSN